MSPDEPARPADPRSDRSVDDVVLEANQSFYDAFEAADLDAMSALWEHSEQVSCVHPGWPRLRGWDAVRRSWEAILAGPDRLQIILTEVDVEVADDLAWVSVDENLLGRRAATVTALNLFRRGPDGRWRLVVHQGSAVVARPDQLDR